MLMYMIVSVFVLSVLTVVNGNDKIIADGILVGKCRSRCLTQVCNLFNPFSLILFKNATDDLKRR